MLFKHHVIGRACNGILMVIFIFMFISCGIQSPAEEAFQRGIFYEKKEQYDNAIAEYTKSFHIDPNYTKIFFKRGLRHKNLEYISTVISDYLDIMGFNQGQITGYGKENLPDYYESFEKAISHFTESIRFYPKTAGLYYNRGIAYYLSGNFDKSIADFTKAIELNPLYADAYYKRSLSYYAKAQIDHVVWDCSKTIELNTTHAYAYYVRGVAYKFQNKLDEALGDFTKAIENYKNFDNAYYKRGHIYYDLVQRGNRESIDLAISDYNMAIKINPDNPNYYFSRGAAYSRYENDYDKAIDDFNKVIEILPYYGTAYYNRAKAYFGKKEYDKSWEDMHKAEEMGFKSGSQFLDQLKEASGRVRQP